MLVTRTPGDTALVSSRRVSFAVPTATIDSAERGATGSVLSLNTEATKGESRKPDIGAESREAPGDCASPAASADWRGGMPAVHLARPGRAKLHTCARRRALAAVTGLGAAAALAVPAVASGSAAAPPTRWVHTATIAGLGGVVALSGDGTTLVAGAGGKDIVYVRSGTRWTRRETLPAVTNGTALAISRDGGTILVGGPSQSDLGHGVASFFVRHNGLWTRQAAFLGPAPDYADYFGSDVALSADGNTALVGFDGDFGPNGPTRASVSFFARSGTRWTRTTVLTQPQISDSTNYGFGVGVLSGDGQTALLNWNQATGSQSVATFADTSAGWTEEGAPLTDPAGVGYGAAALSDTGTTAVVTGIDASAPYNGHVTVLVGSGGTWSVQAKITQAGIGSSATFHPPAPVALPDDASTLLVGSISRGAGRGTGAIYARSGTIWTKIATLAAPGSEPAGTGAEQLGVAISRTGTMAVISEPGANGARGALGVYTLEDVLTHAQWVWVHGTYIPTHFAARLRAAIWTRLTANPNAAYALVERYGPAGVR